MWGAVDTSNDPRCREIRRCGKCTAPSITVVHVIQHYNRGLPMGRTYTHRCGACNTTFDSISWWRAISSVGFAGMITVFGFGMITMLLGNLYDYGFDAVLNGNSRAIGYGLFGFALFLGGLAWAAW